MGAEVAAGVGIVSGIGGIIGGAGSAMEGQNASRAQREAAAYRAEAAKLRNKQSKLTAQRQREEAIKEARVTRASLVTTGAAEGQLGSSSVQGAAGSLKSQLSANLGFGSMMERIQEQMAEYENRAILAGNEASAASERSSAWNSAGDFLGGLGETVNDFGKFNWG